MEEEEEEDCRKRIPSGGFSSLSVHNCAGAFLVAGGLNEEDFQNQMQMKNLRLVKFLQNTSNELYFETRQSKLCGFSIYIFDISKSKSMVRLVRAEKMVLSGLVFARKIARMIFI